MQTFGEIVFLWNAEIFKLINNYLIYNHIISSNKQASNSAKIPILVLFWGWLMGHPERPNGDGEE